jgi:uncharacterized repeat protein (TIGR02543 family)
MKRILAIVLAAMLLMAFVPASARGVRANTQRTTLLDLSNTNSSTSNANEGWAFNPTGNNGKPLLTLTNYGTANAHSAPIKLPKNTTVRVVGDCYIDNSVISNTIYDVIYAPVDGNLWFEGEGTLNLYAPNANNDNGKCIFLNTGGTNANDEWLYINDLTINCYSKEYQNPANYNQPCISGGLCIEIRNATVRTYGGLRGIYTFGYGAAGATEEQQNHILIENSVVYVENQSQYLTYMYGNGIYISGGRIMLINSDVTVYADTGALQCHNNTLLVDGGSVKVYSRPIAVHAHMPAIRVNALKITENTDLFYVGTHDPRYIYIAGNDHDAYLVNISSELTCTIGSYTATSINYGLDPNRDNLPAFEVRKEVGPATYTVTFVDGLTGETIATEQVTEGGSATAPAAPAHEGYTFTGWSGDYTNVTGNVTVTATYMINKYTLVIYYVDDEGHAMAVPATLTYDHGTNYSIPSPVIEGYTANIPVVSGVLTANTTVTVIYTINTYTVTFYDWDGSVIDTQTVAHGSAATAPADPVREGYAFTGWDTDFSNVTGDLAVTALYEEIQITVFPGDVDCNGLVNMADLALAASYVQNSGEVTAQGILNGDMNGDGAITAADLAALYSLILG